MDENKYYPRCYTTSCDSNMGCYHSSGYDYLDNTCYHNSDTKKFIDCKDKTKVKK